MGPAATHTLLVAAVLFCMLLYAAGASPARLGLGRACRSFDDHNAGLALNWSRSPWTATADGHLHGTAEDRTPGGAATDWAGPFPGAGAPGADGTLALNATPAFRPNRTLAVFIAGMRSRFILDSTLERVIRQCTCDGFVVHVYLSLVGFQGRGVARDWMGEVLEPDPATRDMAHDEFDAHVRDGIVRAGGHLVYHRHSRRKESLAPIPNVWTLRSRLTQYSPSANDPSGHNVLRLWRTRETMWNASLEMERMHCAKYTFVLWQRDDTYWGWPLQLAQFEANRTVYSRDCHTFEGINDKVVLLGRRAAPALMTAYSAFYQPKLRLSCHNAELFFWKLAHIRRVRLLAVSIMLLPAFDAMFRPNATELCIKRLYSCMRTMPHWAPPFCSEYKPGAGVFWYDRLCNASDTLCDRSEAVC